MFYEFVASKSTGIGVRGFTSYKKLEQTNENTFPGAAGRNFWCFRVFSSQNPYVWVYITLKQGCFSSERMMFYEFVASKSTGIVIRGFTIYKNSNKLTENTFPGAAGRFFGVFGRFRLKILMYGYI